jgi:hypothetical protein
MIMENSLWIWGGRPRVVVSCSSDTIKTALDDSSAVAFVIVF